MGSTGQWEVGKEGLTVRLIQDHVAALGNPRLAARQIVKEWGVGFGLFSWQEIFARLPLQLETSIEDLAVEMNVNPEFLKELASSPLFPNKMEAMKKFKKQFVLLIKYLNLSFSDFSAVIYASSCSGTVSEFTVHEELPPEKDMDETSVHRRTSRIGRFLQEIQQELDLDGQKIMPE